MTDRLVNDPVWCTTSLMALDPQFWLLLLLLLVLLLLLQDHAREDIHVSIVLVGVVVAAVVDCTLAFAAAVLFCLLPVP